MGKQCVVIAVFLAVRENSNAGAWMRGGIATNPTRLRLNRLIFYVCKTFPESNRAGLIGEWTGKIRIIARGRYDVAVTVVSFGF